MKVHVVTILGWRNGDEAWVGTGIGRTENEARGRAASLAPEGLTIAKTSALVWDSDLEDASE